MQQMTVQGDGVTGPLMQRGYQGITGHPGDTRYGDAVTGGGLFTEQLDPGLYRTEGIGQVADPFTGPQQQQATRHQRKLQGSQYPLLGIRLQVDQHIAADRQVNPGKGRVSQQVVMGKDQHTPDLGIYPVAAILFRTKVTIKKSGRHAGQQITAVGPP